VLVGLGALLLRRDAGSSAIALPATAAEAVAEPVSDPREASSREQVLPPAQQAPPSDGTPAAVLAADAAQTWTLWGHVLELDTDSPVADCIVQIGKDLKAPTDARGRFEVEVDGALLPAGESRPILVLDARGVIQANEFLPVMPGLELRVQGLLLLHGRVVDADGRGLAVEGVAVETMGDGLHDQGQFLGRTEQPILDGRFRIATRRVLPSMRQVRVNARYMRTLFWSLCDLEVLKSAEGATIVVDACTLRFEIVDREGRALEVTELRTVAWLPDEGRASIISFPEVDAAGVWEIALPRAAVAVEASAGAKEHFALIEERSGVPCGETWTFVLAPMGPDDLITGRVLDADGRPVAAAFASCGPPHRDDTWVGVPAIRGVRTDADGRFSMPFEIGKPALLYAHHRDRGSTAYVTAMGGNRDVILRFEAVEKVRVNARRSLATTKTPRLLGWKWFLALQDGGSDYGFELQDEFEIEGVPVGSHRLFLASREGELFGLGSLNVYPGVEGRIEVDLATANWVRGRVSHADGTPASGLSVELAEPSWPRELREAWARTLTTADGSFRVLCGLQHMAPLNISQDATLVLEVTARFGENNRIVLP
jgi:hypothetical protein